MSDLIPEDVLRAAKEAASVFSASDAVRPRLESSAVRAILAERLSQADAIAAKDREIAETRQRTIEECAKVIEGNILTNTIDGEKLRPRQNGNIAGIGYAAAIRSLGKEGSGE